jgi:hypothetical protein
MVKLDGSGSDPTDKVQIGDATLSQALRFNGSGPAGLLRAGVAALLNASNDTVAYPYSTNEVIFAIDDALEAGEPSIGNLAGQLDRFNNIGCPLD